MDSTRTDDYIAANIYVLNQGRELLRKLDDAAYCTHAMGGRSAAGVHLRHALDFYALFFEGLDNGYIDYDRRARDKRVEQSRELALERIDEHITRLRGLADLDRAIRVKVDVGDDPANTDSYSASSVRRELQSLVGHTIHHYALITYVLRAQGIEADPEFGVAPSTLDYWQRSAPL
jgi:hypothetical protein